MGSAEAADPLIGEVVGGRWRVVRPIGQGAMGRIYEVSHTRLSRSFALKTLTPALAGDPAALARFRREAQTVASLRHPNIVEIVDWDALADGTPCIVMELLQGEDLGARLGRSGPLGWAAIARIGDQILAALSVAHRAGVIHRDLKPANIFLCVDDAHVERVKLLDFGVSKVRDGESLHTGDRALGTPLYMSPEQADLSSELGPEADAWAVGAILYEMAAGRPAFAAKSPPAILYRICHGRPDPIGGVRADVPPAFVELLERVLSTDPERRIADADELRRELAAASRAAVPVQIPVPIPVPVPVPLPVSVPPRRHRGRWTLVAVLAALGGLLWAWRTATHAPRVRPASSAATAVAPARVPLAPVPVPATAPPARPPAGTTAATEPALKTPSPLRASAPASRLKPARSARSHEPPTAPKAAAGDDPPPPLAP